MLVRSTPAICGLDASRLYRAYVSPLSVSHPEIAVFVEAPSRDQARRRICELVALITRRTADDVTDALYNLFSAQELLEEGMSDDPERRLFECGWSSERISYIDAPLFLVREPGPLLGAWLKTRRTHGADAPANVAMPVRALP